MEHAQKSEISLDTTAQFGKVRTSKQHNAGTRSLATQNSGLDPDEGSTKDKDLNRAKRVKS